MRNQNHVCPRCGEPTLEPKGVTHKPPLPYHQYMIQQGADPYEIDWEAYLFECHRCGWLAEFRENTTYSDLMAERIKPGMTRVYYNHGDRSGVIEGRDDLPR